MTNIKNQKRPHNNCMSDEIVSECIDLYMEGLNCRAIQNHLLHHRNITISHATIFYWIQKYAEILPKFTDTQKPRTGTVWQIDEIYMRFEDVVKNPDPKKNIMPWGFWVIVCIDKKTKYVVHAMLAFDRSTSSMDKFMRTISSKANAPEVIETDSYIAYTSSIRKYFPDTKHKPRNIKLKATTTCIERFNKILINRTKTMQGLKNFDTCEKNISLFIIWYNYLRPYMTIMDGMPRNMYKTPAQAADIDLDLSERWLSLFKLSERQSRSLLSE